jgi:tetratricopeptide (TPR) repeat protein
LHEALDGQRRIFGPDHPSVASTLVNLAEVAQQRGDLDEAYTLLHEALDGQRRIFGPDHPSVASTLVNLAEVAQQRGDLDEAYGLLLEGMETSKLSGFESQAGESEWDSVSAKARRLLHALDSTTDNAGH